MCSFHLWYSLSIVYVVSLFHVGLVTFIIFLDFLEYFISRIFNNFSISLFIYNITLSLLFEHFYYY